MITDTAARGAPGAMTALVAELVGDQAEEWDRRGRLPVALVRELAGRGMLCAQVPARYGGPGLTAADGGAFTAGVGRLCSSLRSVMTSQGMAAWTIEKLGGAAQREAHLPELAGGRLAAVAFSEPGAGSDLSAIDTRIRAEGDEVVVDGRKVWITGAAYADLLVVFGRLGDGAAAVLVPASAPGVRVERVPDPLGCRAAGHADVHLDSVRLPADSVLERTAGSVELLVTPPLTYGRLSVAWGCVGILRACLDEATGHARSRVQFGRPLADHQLVARHLAEILVGEQVATRTCEHASRCWDAGLPETPTAAVLAKHVGAVNAVRGASAAVQVLGSAGARDGRAAARAYRDAKLMEIIEGSSEICRLILARHALTVPR
ncbi:acyl-CoA dehydrogenase family protein [Actinomadura sp. 6K520]|uniref:acyl-CoA dehydrogenase family protein n=1 Tax=Actinomadura sp. 6K520 TaxID=2530364 RepID=UPI001FB8027D|nr:acyl-CoA dehydrogenase family protein [Actinomadura sp. 6K520]